MVGVGFVSACQVVPESSGHFPSRCHLDALNGGCRLQTVSMDDPVGKSSRRFVTPHTKATPTSTPRSGDGPTNSPDLLHGGADDQGGAADRLLDTVDGDELAVEPQSDYRAGRDRDAGLAEPPLIGLTIEEQDRIVHELEP